MSMTSYIQLQIWTSDWTRTADLKRQAVSHMIIYTVRCKHTVWLNVSCCPPRILHEISLGSRRTIWQVKPIVKDRNEVGERTALWAKLYIINSLDAQDEWSARDARRETLQYEWKKCKLVCQQETLLSTATIASCQNGKLNINEDSKDTRVSYQTHVMIVCFVLDHNPSR